MLAYFNIQLSPLSSNSFPVAAGSSFQLQKANKVLASWLWNILAAKQQIVLVELLSLCL